jgi:hypothetical protein
MSISMKLEKEVINEFWNSDPEEVVKKYQKDSLDYYPFDLDDNDYSDFENQYIKNQLLQGVCDFRMLNPPKMVFDNFVKTQRSQIKTTLWMLCNEVKRYKWETRVHQLYSNYLEMTKCDIDDQFSIEMKDIEDLIHEDSKIKESVLKEMRKDVYKLIDEHNKQFMGEK